MTVRFYLKKTPKGVSVLRVEVRQNENKVSKKLANLNAEHWNVAAKLPLPGCDDYEGLLSEVLTIKQQAVKQRFLRITNPKNAMDFLFEPLLGGQLPGAMDFFSYFNTYINNLELLKKYGNAEINRTAYNKLKAFTPTLYFDQLTPAVLEKFKQFCLIDQLSKTTIHTYLRKYRAVYNQAVKLEGVENNRPFDGVFKDVATRSRRQKNRYLLKDGLLMLKNATTNHPAQQRVIDLALLQFYLGGMDFIDVYHLKRANLVNGRYYYNRIKLGDKGYEIDIKVFPCAMEIINKYADPEDKEYFFSWRKLHSSYRNFRSNQIRRLKKIQEINEIELLPTNQALNTKALRHTFSTIGKFAHIDSDLLRELMGHERNDIDTVYKDKFQEAERDAAHWKIIDLNGD